MKVKLSGLLIAAILAINTLCHGQHYWLKNVNIINIENGEILENHHILIKDGLIKSINKKLNKSERNVVDGTGKYVIPGLWDMHVHLDMVGDASMPLFLNYGITGVRDMGGDINLIKKYKERPDYPTILTAGAILESPRFYQIVTLLLGEAVAKTRVPFGDPDIAGQLVDSLISSGSDFIKIRTALNQEVFESLGRVCKERGISLAGHIDPNIDFLAAIKSGIGSIEHTEFHNILEMDEAQKVELAKVVASENVFYTPTLITGIKNRGTPKTELTDFLQDTLNINYPERAYISSKLLENWKVQQEIAKLEGPIDWDEMLPEFFSFGKKMADHGVPLLAGTDCGIFLVIPGRSLHEELELLVKHFNVSNLEALQSATINPARYLNRPNEGVIKEGTVANLLLLDANPLEDISNTQKIDMVIKSGKMYTKQERADIFQDVIHEIENERKVHVNSLLEYYYSSLKKLMNSQDN